MNATAEKKWIEDFILELRLREVRGDAIGDAVASVKELLADTGQAPEQVFGTPRAYANQLDLPLVENAGFDPRSTIGFGIGVLALLIYSPAIWAYFEGKPLGYSLPQLLLLLVPVLVVATIPLYVEKLIHKVWIIFPLLFLSSGAAVASTFLAPVTVEEAWLQVEALPVAAIAAVILVATAVWDVRKSTRIPDDPIINPLTTSKEPSGLTKFLLAALPPALMPLFALGLTITAWLMNR